MHEKRIVWRFEIVVFSVMGPCNPNSTDDLAWTYCCNHLMACVDRIRMLLQNIHYHVCTRLYGVLTQTTLWILTTVNTSNPLPKIIKNWNIDGNVTLGNLNYTRAVYIITQYLISHTFSTIVYTVIYYVSKKRRKQTVFNINTHFMIRTTYVEFQTSTTIIPQENLTSECEISSVHDNEKIKKTVQEVRFPVSRS